jgi:DnaD/phage-associated family protein
MAWTRIDDKFLMNPKVQSAGAYGMALYLSGLIYCNTNLTDGFIPDVMLPVLCGLAYQTPNRRIAETLVALNLWERVPGGYQIHDFLMFNKSKHDIELLNKQRAVNGAKNKREIQQTNTKTDTRTGTGIGTGSGSNSVPIIPNTLIPNTLNPEKIITTTGGAENFSAIVSAYEAEIGAITASIADELKLAVSEYPDGWIIDALKEAALQNKRNWSYARAILKRWKAEGRGNGNRKQGGADVDKYRALYQQQKAGG